MLPIGPKARHLNRDFAYEAGKENQLAHWSRSGALAGAPAPEHAPRLAVWDDPKTGSSAPALAPGSRSTVPIATVPKGPRATRASTCSPRNRIPRPLASSKPPVAAGIGSGGLPYDIVPGKPDQSILAFRIASTHPGIMMPELGKRMVHTEGVALVREWIANMAPLAR